MSSGGNAPNLPTQVLADRLHLSIPSLPGWIEPTVDYLRQRALLMGVCTEGRAGKLMVALHEALSNAVIHGNLGLSSELKEHDDDAFAEALAARAADAELASRPVDVVVDYDGEACRWVITDQGQGFNVQHVLERCLSEEPQIQLASGRGILMMHSFLDEVRFELGGRRAILTMRRPAGPERRCGPRHPVSAPLRVAPLRPDGTPDWNAAYDVMARDLSSEGIALWQQGLAPAQRILIGVTRGAELTYVPAEVRHCRPLADGSMELGCRFLLEATPPGTAPAEADQLAEVQDAVAALMNQTTRPATKGHEARVHPRVAFNERIDVLIEGRPEPIVAFARDLSRGGLAFITRTQLPADIVVVFLNAAQQPALGVQAQVVRCVKITEGFYDVGARFTRLSGAPDLHRRDND
jgi:anti-sigma regulatory factor (Ser/Thr protein kinase)